MMRGVRLLGGVLACTGLSLAACGGSGREATRHPDRMSIWAEYLDATDVPARFAFAGSERLNVNVSVVRGVHDRAYLEAICAAAEANDVAVRLWPGLPYEEGYWPSQANVDPFLEWVDALLADAETACPGLDGIVVDLEMPIYRVEELAAMRDAGVSEVAIAQWLIDGIDEQAFEAARAQYGAAVARLQGDGYWVGATTLPMNADDYLDGDETIAKALWTPVEGIEWSAVSFQVYRSLYDAQFPPESGAPYTSGLVGSYARTIVERWGARGGVDLGTTGTGIGVPMGLASAGELQSDIAAALAEGIDPGHVAIYSIEGLDGKSDAETWVEIPAPLAATPTADDEEARALFQTLDILGR